jgi:anhydro-N-acetylmuramic acid kinase
MHYVGLMSGTSVNSIDAALLSIPPDGPLLKSAVHYPIPDALRNEIELLSRVDEQSLSAANELERAMGLDIELGSLFAEAALAVVAQSGVSKKSIRAIGSHGQTIRHRPNARRPFSTQLANPSVIAELTGITTVADFRARDISAGGQGAPLVSGFHYSTFRSQTINRVVLNIGGIANVTYLPANSDASVLGFDTGPGNTLLDRWVQSARGHDFDDGGNWAKGGSPNPKLLERLLTDPYFKSPPPKSTGREEFNLEWLHKVLNGLGHPLDPQCVQATLLQFTADSIVRAFFDFLPTVDEVYVCGGGAHNGALIAAIGKALGRIPLQTTAVLGLEPDWVEAAAFAWLAHQTLEGQPGNLPSVTGARKPVILGGIYKA